MCVAWVFVGCLECRDDGVVRILVDLNRPNGGEVLEIDQKEKFDEASAHILFY